MGYSNSTPYYILIFYNPVLVLCCTISALNIFYCILLINIKKCVILYMSTCHEIAFVVNRCYIKIVLLYFCIYLVTALYVVQLI